MLEKIATKVIWKYLKKGNMSRCLRDILPSTNLTREQREAVADIVHDVVRWKRLYELILDEEGSERTAENYVELATNDAQKNANLYPFEYQCSCSDYVATLLKDQMAWARYLNDKPPTTLCVNFNMSSTKEVVNTLKKEKLQAKLSKIETAVLTESNARYSSVIKNRYAHVQDESSQLISYLTLSLGDSILDFCAGNGGKSLSMASIARNKKTIHAYEINEKKRAVIKQRCTEYDAKTVVEEQQPKSMFDVVLVDAPCSGIGTARRNPEAKYFEGETEFKKLQLKILKDASKNVKTRGFILYSVCTITPEETEEVIKQFTKKKEFKVSKFKELDYSELLKQNKYGAFTAVPNGDLFFVSLLKKEKEKI